MSIISIPIGQCGIQTAHCLYDFIYQDLSGKTSSNLKTKKQSVPIYSNKSEYVRKSLMKWFQLKKNGLILTRSVLIDTEDKVANFVKTVKKDYKFRTAIAKAQGGSANNFACGYTEKRKSIEEDCLNGVRKEVEECDNVSDLLPILSIAGGTGSGVGTYLLEKLKEEYPKKTVATVAVFPYENGDVITQSYNALFALTKLYKVSDALIVFDNDHLNDVCTKKLKVKDVSLNDLNVIISQQLTALLQPISGSEIKSVSEIVSDLTAHPAYKFLQIRSGPHFNVDYKKFESDPQWHVLFRNCLQELKRSVINVGTTNYKTAGNLLITRGGSKPSETDLQQFKDENLYPDWLPVEARFNTFHHVRQLPHQDSFYTLATNGKTIGPRLNCILEDAWNLFTYKAYVHHYEKYGFDEDYFKNCFIELETVLHDYNCL